MKDQKIELPSTNAVWAAIQHWHTGGGRERVDAALKAHVRVAIEADRKRRGEPVAWKEISLDAISRMRAGHVGCTDFMNRAEALLEAERISPPPADPEDDKLNLDRLADYIADNWPDKKYSLEEIAQGLHATWPGAFMPAEPVKVPSDQFNGDNAALVKSIGALLELDAKDALVPHGIGGHARSLLSAAASRLGQPAQPAACKPDLQRGACGPAASAEPVGEVRHYQYSGVARTGFRQEAVLSDDAPVVPHGTKLYAAPVAAQPTGKSPLQVAAQPSVQRKDHE